MKSILEYIMNKGASNKTCQFKFQTFKIKALSGATTVMI